MKSLKISSALGLFVLFVLVMIVRRHEDHGNSVAGFGVAVAVCAALSVALSIK